MADTECCVDPVRESDQIVDPSDDVDWRELKGLKVRDRRLSESRDVANHDYCTFVIHSGQFQ